MKKLYTIKNGKMKMTFDAYMSFCNRYEAEEWKHKKKNQPGEDFVWANPKDPCPTVDELKALNPDKNFEKYFPYLLYYYEVCMSDDTNLKTTSHYIDELFQKHLEINENPETEKMEMTFDKYMGIVHQCEEMRDNLLHDPDNALLLDSIDRWPSVDELQAHHVEENFQTYLPYLVYFSEVFETNDPGFQGTAAYIQRIMSEHLEIID